VKSWHEQEYGVEIIHVTNMCWNNTEEWKTFNCRTYTQANVCWS